VFSFLHQPTNYNVALLAFAAERRAAAPMLSSASRAAIGRYLPAAGRAHSSKPAAAACGGRMIGRMDILTGTTDSDLNLQRNTKQRVSCTEQDQ